MQVKRGRVPAGEGRQVNTSNHILTVWPMVDHTILHARRSRAYSQPHRTLKLLYCHKVKEHISTQRRKANPEQQLVNPRLRNHRHPANAHHRKADNRRSQQLSLLQPVQQPRIRVRPASLSRVRLSSYSTSPRDRTPPRGVAGTSGRPFTDEDGLKRRRGPCSRVLRRAKAWVSE